MKKKIYTLLFMTIILILSATTYAQTADTTPLGPEVMVIQGSLKAQEITITQRMQAEAMKAREAQIDRIRIAENARKGSVLVSDSVGNATWQDIPTPKGSWYLTGNSNTIPGTNFIGTIDEKDLYFKVNNQLAGLLNISQSNTSFGYQSFMNISSGMYNTAIGYSTLFSNMTGNENTALGYQSLKDNTSGNYNTAIGTRALMVSNGDNNTAIGAFSLVANTSGVRNVSIGWLSLGNNNTGYDNTAGGTITMRNNTSGANNTAFGYSSLYFNSTGSRNSALGQYALDLNTTGNDNTALGYRANVANGNLINTMAVGANSFAGASNSLVLGSISGVNGATASVNVGIGITTPEERLHVVGKTKTIEFQMSNGASEGFILQSDANGNASWVNINALLNKNTEEDLKKIIAVSDEKIADLQNQINDLKKLILSIQINNPDDPANTMTVDAFSTSLSDQATLGQNIPNPFTNSTVINYTLPQKFTAAKMVITDKNGKVIKEVTISGRGKGMLTVDASTLTNGAYQYSLWVEGKLLATKQMVLVK